MNTTFLAILKRIISEKGEDVFSNPRLVSAMLGDIARDVPKPQKNVFIKCLEHKSAQFLKSAAEKDRPYVKEQLALRLQEEEALDLKMCADMLDLLEAAIFEKDEEPAEKKIFCPNCKKELQEEWVACPFCLTPRGATSPANSDLKPKIATPSAQAPAKSGDVYVAGGVRINEISRGIRNSFTNAVLWKNGSPHMLSNKPSSAYSVFVSGNDVYVAGQENSKAVLWRNGTRQILSNEYSLAKSVFVFGSDVFVAGWGGESFHENAMLWKNGNLQILTNKDSDRAYSVFVSGNDVYVAGSTGIIDNHTAVLWKNGARQVLLNGVSITQKRHNMMAPYAHSVFVSSSNVYIAGLENDNAVLWKNNTPQILSKNTLNAGLGAAESVYVSGNDVYVAGRENNKAVLWRNGTPYLLSDKSPFVYSVYVSGNDVYVAGEENNIAVLWKNGSPHILSDKSSYAHSVFVT